MTVRGISVTEQTQCVHYQSEVDVVAVRFKCFDAFYACIRCHEELADPRRCLGARASVRQMQSTAAAAAVRCRSASIAAAGAAVRYVVLLSIPAVRTITISTLSYSDALHLTNR